MNYQVSNSEKSTVKIVFTFDAEEWAQANNEAYMKGRGKYSVNGFRKGKAPKHVLEMYYGKGLFYEDAINVLLARHYDEVIAKEKERFTVVGKPSFAVDDLTDEKLVLSAIVPVKPDIKIGSYKGIKIRKYVYTVSDADVEKDIESTRARLAEKEEVSRPAQLGDTATIDFTGKLDGKEFEGGSAKGHDLELGSHSFIPGFEEGVVGMAVGETKDIPVTFPDDYQAEDLKGKEAVFTVTLHKLTGKKLPELDEAFAKKLGSESVEEYRAKVRERLEKNAGSRSTNDTENSILTEIAKTVEAEIPDAMIDEQEEYFIQRMEYNLMYQGIKSEDYFRYIGVTREEYKKNFEEQARTAVLHQLIIEKLIEIEKITASEEEIEEKIAEQAKSVGKEAEEYKKTMDPRQRAYIESDIKVVKLFALLEKLNEMYEEEEKGEQPAKKPSAKKPAAKKTAEKKED